MNKLNLTVIATGVTSGLLFLWYTFYKKKRSSTPVCDTSPADDMSTTDEVTAAERSRDVGPVAEMRQGSTTTHRVSETESPLDREACVSLGVSSVGGTGEDRTPTAEETSISGEGGTPTADSESLISDSGDAITAVSVQGYANAPLEQVENFAYELPREIDLQTVEDTHDPNENVDIGITSENSTESSSTDNVSSNTVVCSNVPASVADCSHEPANSLASIIRSSQDICDTDNDTRLPGFVASASNPKPQEQPEVLHTSSVGDSDNSCSTSSESDHTQPPDTVKDQEEPGLQPAHQEEAPLCSEAALVEDGAVVLEKAAEENGAASDSEIVQDVGYLDGRSYPIAIIPDSMWPSDWLANQAGTPHLTLDGVPESEVARFEKEVPGYYSGLLLGKNGVHAKTLKERYGGNLQLSSHPRDPGQQVLSIVCKQERKEEVRRWLDERLRACCKGRMMRTRIGDPEQLRRIPKVKELFPVQICDMSQPRVLHLRIYNPDMSAAFTNLQEDMTRTYTANESSPPRLPSPITVGCICIARVTMRDRGEVYARAHVVLLHSTSPGPDQPEVQTCATVYLLDFSGFYVVPVIDLYKTKVKFMELPFQVTTCVWAHAEPVDETISPAYVFERYFKGRLLYAFVPRMETCCVPHVILYDVVSPTPHGQGFHSDVLVQAVNDGLYQPVRYRLDCAIQCEYNQSSEPYCNPPTSLIDYSSLVEIMASGEGGGGPGVATSRGDQQRGGRGPNFPPRYHQRYQQEQRTSRQPQQQVAVNGSTVHRGPGHVGRHRSRATPAYQNHNANNDSLPPRHRH